MISDRILADIPHQYCSTHSNALLQLVARIGVLQATWNIGEISVILDRFSLGWLSGGHTPLPGACVLITLLYMEQGTKRTVTA